MKATYRKGTAFSLDSHVILYYTILTNLALLISVPAGLTETSLTELVFRETVGEEAIRLGLREWSDRGDMRVNVSDGNRSEDRLSLKAREQRDQLIIFSRSPSPFFLPFPSVLLTQSFRRLRLLRVDSTNRLFVQGVSIVLHGPPATRNPHAGHRRAVAHQRNSSLTWGPYRHQRLFDREIVFASARTPTRHFQV